MESSLRMAAVRLLEESSNTSHEFNLLSAFVGWCNYCNNMHGIINIKFGVMFTKMCKTFPVSSSFAVLPCTINLTKIRRAKWAGQAVSMITWETWNGILTLKKSSDESTRFLMTQLKQTWKTKDVRGYVGFNWPRIRSSGQLNNC
jgi:hypothetical protein